MLEEEKMAASGVLSIVLVGDERSQEVNREYLQHDYPTDVLAFLYDEDDDDEIWGEIIINVEKAAEQSSEYGVSYENELARLLIHGVLHLAGYDDQDEEAKNRMKAEEDRLVELAAPIL